MNTQSAPPPAIAWATNSDTPALAAALRAARSVVIVTHAKPDGDALGSSLALARALARAGVGAELWLVGPIPRWIGEFAGRIPIRELKAGSPLAFLDGKPATDPDLVAVVDTGSWTQLSELRPFLEPRADRTILVDHHLHGDAAVATRRLIDSRCASCTEVLAPLCVALAGVANTAALPLDVAEPLYLGLATDTGWLRYSSVTPHTLRLAADLIQCGVDHTRLYMLIEQQQPAGRWHLLGRALRTLELHSTRGKDDAAIMSLTLADFAQTGADPNDTSGFADMLLTVASVQVSAVLNESPVNPGEPPLTKFSLRSKPGPNAVDVNQVCKKLDGGGHARAAGAKARLPIPAAKAALLEALK
ncbi:MAG TPA: DHH family phosphoesterase [Phycisphaerales bacterium]|nr:DHH family phosphoesterase [Phycisphaerales bacterium]